MLLCPYCGDRTADRLHSVSDLHSELTVTYARQDVLSLTAGRGGEQGLPYGQSAKDADVFLTDTVIYWSQQLAVTRSSLWELPNTLTELTWWLIRRVDWLRALEAAGEAYSMIDRAVTRARYAIDRPVHRTRFPVGPCPEIRNNRYCLGQVMAYVPTRVGVDPAVMRCRSPECRRHREPWGTESWSEAGKRINRLTEQLKRRAVAEQLKRSGLVPAWHGDNPGRCPA
jgi:hypothetical protein